MEKFFTDGRREIFGRMAGQTENFRSDGAIVVVEEKAIVVVDNEAIVVVENEAIVVVENEAIVVVEFFFLLMILESRSTAGPSLCPSVRKFSVRNFSDRPSVRPSVRPKGNLDRQKIIGVSQ